MNTFREYRGGLECYKLSILWQRPSIQNDPFTRFIKAIVGVVTFEKEITTSIPQAKTFKTFILESDTLISKILPQINIEFLEGNRESGTVKKTTFTEGGEDKYIKTKIEATDKDNFTHCSNVVGGKPWLDELEKTSYKSKVVASFDGGSIIKSVSKYYLKEDCELDEESIKAGAEKAFGVFKAIEAYILKILMVDILVIL
eukprot:XP_025012727.1 major allergen Pru ar 1-like [Ricinus communis]